MAELPPFDFAVFDCDGVILDSNSIKSDAFADALDGYPADLVEAFVAYHRANGGISRYVKFDHFFRNMVEEACPEAAAAAVARYAQLVEQRLVACRAIPGVERYLAELQRCGVVCAVNSGGDERELRRVFAARSLDGYFSFILGSPTGKPENMKRLAAEGFRFDRSIYFGDSRADWRTASEFGCGFVFVSGASEWAEGEAAVADCALASIKDFDALQRP